MSVKKKLYISCVDSLDQRFKTITKAIFSVETALHSELKSTAGDKHQTGRAMLQLEREKLGQQLAQVQQQKEILDKINPETVAKKAILGSIVATTNGNYFIAISAGRIDVEGEIFYAISASTPIAKVLLSKEKADKIQFRNSTFVITKIE